MTYGMARSLRGSFLDNSTLGRQRPLRATAAAGTQRTPGFANRVDERRQQENAKITAPDITGSRRKRERERAVESGKLGPERVERRTGDRLGA